MPLKIRCPHCRRVLVAEDEYAGTQTRCPACHRLIDVPLPVHEPPAHIEVAGHCPRCEQAVAPGTSYCPHCYTDLASGKRLPLGRRLRLIPLRVWTRCVLVLGGVVLVLFVGVNIYRDRAVWTQPASQPVRSTRAPEMPPAEPARRLLAAETPNARSAAVAQVIRIGPPALPTLAQALESSLAEPADSQRQRNQRAAIELLARSGDARWQTVLRKCRRQKGLEPDALWALAMVGDPEVLDELVALWLRELRRRVFVAAVARVGPGAVEGAAGTALARSAAQTNRLTEALRRLRRDHAVDVLDRLGQAYWETWSWLGQRRDETVALEIFEIAKPTAATEFEEAKEHIRAARRALDDVARAGSPSARAAAGLVLAQCAPQYASARQRIKTVLADILPTCKPIEQQRLTWTLAELTGLTYGDITADSEPADVQREDVQAVLKWARASNVADPGPLRTSSTAYPRPPTLRRRVVTPQRQLERDLWRQFQTGWASLDATLEHWLAAEVGCTPRVLACLDPGQRAPNYATLAVAMILVAETDAQAARAQLELWHEAPDQPAWVREMAYAVLGSLDAHVGRWRSGWPAELNARVYAELDHGAPGWEHFGRIVAAGGPAMVARLERSGATSLPVELRARLIAAAAEQSAHRRKRDRRP